MEVVAELRDIESVSRAVDGVGVTFHLGAQAAADRLVESFRRSFDLSVTIVRPFNTYGPVQSAGAIVPAVMNQILAGGPVRLGALHPRAI